MGRYEQLFNQIATDLDLTKTEEDAIVKSYEAVGEYLSNSSELSSFYPRIFSQGSMKIGTIVKPLKRDDYDVDLVCELTKNYSNLSPAKVKQLVGKALKCGKYSSQLERERGRCWTLQYVANPPYHLDILPGVTAVGNKITATKKNLDETYEWLSTNPKGFADWFLSLYKHKSVFDEKRDVEKIYRYRKRNPLQRAVQLMKRHRDIYFQYRDEDGPASIIITTLSGLAYKGEDSIEQILRNGPISWASYIKRRENKYVIKVPSLPDDNYADKWNDEDKNGAKLFFEWHAKLISDIDKLLAQNDIDSFLKVAKRMFGDSTIDKTLNENYEIKDSLSYAFKQHYPMVVEDTHPLFKHAISISLDNHRYVPNGNISLKIKGKVFASESDRDLNNEQKCIESFDSNSSLLEKNLFLRFCASINNRPKSCRLRWQITNTGEEAMLNGKENLRGGFENSEESVPWTKFEHTSYAGTHFVQAFLIDLSTNLCVAKSNILTVNICGD